MDEVEAGKMVVKNFALRIVCLYNFLKAIHGEGKEYAMAVGIAKFSTQEMFASFPSENDTKNFL